MKILQWIKIITLASIASLLFIQCPPEIPDEIPPTVVIINPFNGQVVSGSVLVTVGASDDTELDRVNLFIDGVEVSSGSGPLLKYIWNTSPIADNRDHNLHAIAYDKQGNNGFSGNVIVRVVIGAPDTLAPAITILNPVSGSTVSDTVQVVPQIFDDSPILKVDYFVNGKLDFTAEEEPFEFQWIVNNFIDGSTQNIFARAYDVNMNNSVSNIVTVTIRNEDNTPPTLIILYPAEGTQFSFGEDVNIAVDAQDNVGIERVEFYIDGELMQVVKIKPYEYLWSTPSGDGRPHTIYIKAFDFAGNSSAQLITVIINP
jgi:hypothetical protein